MDKSHKGIAFETKGSHIRCKTVNKYLNVRERVEMVVRKNYAEAYLEPSRTSTMKSFLQK